MRYKLKQWYPGLPTGIRVGSILEKNGNYYEFTNQNFRVPAAVLESDQYGYFFEEIDEDDAETLTFDFSAGRMEVSMEIDELWDDEPNMTIENLKQMYDHLVANQYRKFILHSDGDEIPVTKID